MGRDYVLILLLALVSVYVIYRLEFAIHRLVKLRGNMVVTCPETWKIEAVEVAGWRAAMGALFGRKRMELRSCTRWPQRRDCGQDCLDQIKAAPENCRVWTIASRWYEGQKCVYCRFPIAKISHFDRRPALLDADGRTVEWDEIPAEKLLGAFSAYRPVCWSCHVAQTFRREHADLVVDRPWKH